MWIGEEGAGGTSWKLVRDGEKTERRRRRRWTFPSCSGTAPAGWAGRRKLELAVQGQDVTCDSPEPRPAGENLLF